MTRPIDLKNQWNINIDLWIDFAQVASYLHQRYNLASLWVISLSQKLTQNNKKVPQNTQSDKISAP